MEKGKRIRVWSGKTQSEESHTIGKKKRIQCTRTFTHGCWYDNAMAATVTPTTVEASDGHALTAPAASS